MRKKIICLENLPYWSHVKVGSHHYAKLFSEQHDVLWISLPWHLPQLMRYPDNDRYSNWNNGKPVTINHNLRVLVPFTFLPYRNNLFFNSDFILKNYYSFMLPRIKKILRDLNFEDVELLWFSDPRHISILKYVKYNKLAYRCVDDLEHFAEIPKKLAKTEKILIRRCDAVFYTSVELLERYSPLNMNSYYLPNGVDYDFFDESSDPNLLPHWFRKSDKPIAVYVGTVGEWFDAALLSQVAKSLPEVEFAIVGPVRRNVNQLKAQPNVTFYGHVPYESVPTIMKSSNVGIIPFQINKLTEAVCPIKLFEYFACGLPVVAPRTRELRKIASPAQLFSSADEFTSEIKRAVSLREKKSEYMEFARKNSWASRFEIVRKACQSLRFGKQL